MRYQKPIATVRLGEIPRSFRLISPPGHLDVQAKWYLEEGATPLRAAGYAVTAHAVSGEPEDVIAEAVKREDIYLLAMGAYGHARIRAFILGSTTTTMVRTCLVPVLMFR